jgi:hypothetical protein
VSCQPICPKLYKLNLLLSSKMPPIHRLYHTTIGLRQPLVEELHESPFFITMKKASDQQILELPSTFREFLVLILSKGTYLLSCLIYSRHWEKLVVELTQQALPRGNRPRCVGIQPLCGFVMKGERKKSKMDRFLGEILKFGCGIYIFEFFYMAIWVLMI